MGGFNLFELKGAVEALANVATGVYNDVGMRNDLEEHGQTKIMKFEYGDYIILGQVIKKQKNETENPEAENE